MFNYSNYTPMQSPMSPFGYGLNMQMQQAMPAPQAQMGPQMGAQSTNYDGTKYGKLDEEQKQKIGSLFGFGGGGGE